MVAHAQEVRDATNAVETALKRLEELKVIVDRHTFDEHLHRLGPMLTDYISVVFAAGHIVSRAVESLRAVSLGPKVIGEHSAASYHELAMRLAEEPIWLTAQCGMNDPGKTTVFNALTGHEDRPTGDIAEISRALNNLGGVADPVAAIAGMREMGLSGVELDWLRSCVLNEGAIAADDKQNPGPRYLDLAIDGESLTRGDAQVALTGNGLRLVALLHAAESVGISHGQLTEMVFDTVVTRNAFDQLVATVRRKLAPLGLTLEARTRGIWTLVEAAKEGQVPSLSKD